MDHSWQHRQPMQGGNICPSCSTSHFPFCPQINPIYPNDHPRPYFHPHSTHPASVGRASYPNPGDPGQLHYAGQFHFHHQQQVGDYGSVHNATGSALQSSNYDGNLGVGTEHVGNTRTSKRLRIDGAHRYGTCSGGVDVNSSRVLSEENERRLKLIRDHGAALGGQYASGSGSVYDSNHVSLWRPDSIPDAGYGEPYRPVEGQSGFGPMHTDNHRQHLYGERANPSHLPAHGNLGRPGDTNSANSNTGDSVARPRGYQHTTDGSFGCRKDFTPQHYEPGNWNNFHQRSNVGLEHRFSSYDYPSSHQGDARQQVDARPLTLSGRDGAAPYLAFPVENPCAKSPVMKQGACFPKHDSRGFDLLPPLPFSSPPPIPSDPARHWAVEFKPSSSSPKMQPCVFPIGVTSAIPHTSCHSGGEIHPPPQPYFSHSQPMHASGSFIQGSSIQTPQGQYFGEPEGKFLDKSKIIDASDLFKPPGRASRPDHFVIILRGLPGSGKSYLAKMLRDLEVDNGGDAPRIHSMDDYFLTEVEKLVENTASKTSARGRKPATKKVLEYCYEPEMLETYQASMLKAFKRTLEEGAFTFVIVDDRNLRVADFAQFWATAKRSGYEVYLLEAPYKDPAGCTARNVHGFSLEEIENMAAELEEAPPFYQRLDVKSLFHGDDLKDNDIKEVDMDMEDDDDEGFSKLENLDNTLASMAEDAHKNGSPEEEKNSSAEGDITQQELKDLGHSKWLGDSDDVDVEGTEVMKDKSSVLSGLLQTYGMEGKSVHWGDKAINTGFSIGALKKANMASLVIGPGAGYNLKSNPLSEEDTPLSAQNSGTERHHIFEERLRAERQSFKAVFDKRRRRIGGLNEDDE